MEVDNRFQFGPFCLDAEERVLLRDGRLVQLAPKALSTLLVLVRNMGHVVEKDVLMAEVWPHEDVEEGNLAQHIFMLRRALGESSQYIETVPRRGYRFLNAVGRGKEPSKHYTDNSEVYQAYLKGRSHWSRHTRDGLKQAVGYFRQAISLDPSYALAFAAMVDCHLRLATNYLPPADALPDIAFAKRATDTDEILSEAQASIKIRCEWDKKIAESEYKRALELKSNPLAAHQWHAAYLFSHNLYSDSLVKTGGVGSITDSPDLVSDAKLPDQLQYSRPTLAEKVQVFCVIARGQIYAGNYDGACSVLERWWTMGEWPKLDSLSPHSSADLLLTAGTLAGFVASTRQVPSGQKHAEALLSGAIGLFEQLGSLTLSAEGRIELALCYQREGMYDLARTTLMAALRLLPSVENEIKRFALIRLATVEWQAGRLRDSIKRLNEAEEISELTSPMTTGRYHMELATTLQTLGTAEMRSEYFNRALDHYLKAMEQYEAIGNHRFAAIVENNHGFLLVTLKLLDEAEFHLVRAQKLFAAVNDKRRGAGVADSLARLHLAAGRTELAEQAVGKAVKILETGGMEAYLAEALTTQGLVLCRLGRYREAKLVLEHAYSVAERCGDRESAGHALLTQIEEMCEQFEDEELLELGARLDHLLADSQQASTLNRLRKCQERITSAHASLEPR